MSTHASELARASSAVDLVSAEVRALEEQLARDEHAHEEHAADLRRKIRNARARAFQRHQRALAEEEAAASAEAERLRAAADQVEAEATAKAEAMRADAARFEQRAAATAERREREAAAMAEGGNSNE